MKRKACPTRPEVLPHVQNLQFNAESSPFHLPPTNPTRVHARRKTSPGHGLASLLPLALSEVRSACSSASRSSSRVSSSASSKGKASSFSGASQSDSSRSALSLCVSATPSPVVCPTPTSILSALRLPPQPGPSPPPPPRPQPLLPPAVGDGDDGSSSRRRVSQSSATDIVAYLSSIRRGSESTLGDATPREVAAAAAAEAALTTAALPSTPLSTTKKVAEFLAHPERCGPMRGGYSFLLEAEAWKEAADAKTAKGERMRAGLAMRLSAVFPSKVDRDGNELPLTDEEWGTMTGHELKVLKKKCDGTPRRRRRYAEAYAKFKAAILSWEQYERQRNSALACVVVQGVGGVHALPPQQGPRPAEQARIDAVRFDEELRRFHLRREKRIQERARGNAPCLDLIAALPEDVQSRLARHLAPSGPDTPPHDAEACWRQRKQAWLEQYVYHHSSCGAECACELAALLDTATVPARAPVEGASAPSLACTSCSSCVLPSLAAAAGAGAAGGSDAGLPRPPSAASHVSRRSLQSAGSHATTQSTATTPSFSWSSDEQPSDEESAPASPSLHSTLASFFPALECSPGASGAPRPASEKGSVEGSPLEHTVPQADPLTPTDLRPKRSSSSLKTLLLSEGVAPAADAAQRSLEPAGAAEEASSQQQQPAPQTKPSSPGGRKERVSLVVDLNSLLGFGAHGRVYRGVLEGAFGSTQQDGAAADAAGSRAAASSKKVVAVKKIPLESLKGKGRDRLGHFGNVHLKGPAAAGHGNESMPSESGRLKQELDVWQKLTNNVGATGYGAFIVKYYGHTYNKRQREYSLVMEHCRYGSVHDLLNRLWHVRGLQGVGVGLGSVEHGAEEMATSLPRTGSIPGPGSIRRKSSTMSLCLSICSGSADHDDGDPTAIFKHDGTIARLNLEELYLATSIVDDTSGGSADGSSTDRFYGNPSRGTGSRGSPSNSRVLPLDGSPRGTQEAQEAASSCASSARSRGTARLTAACSDPDGDSAAAAAAAAQRAAVPAFDPDQPPSLPERCLSRIAAHVLEGLVYLHSQNVIHRDVKTSNMLLGGDGFVKLCDFGVSTMLASDRSLRKSCVGTPGYLPPEVIQEQPYNTSADIWSFGCSLLEMATGKRPYQGLNTAAVMLRTVTQPHPPIPDGLPLNLKLMLLACLQKDPMERPRPQALLAHPFSHAGGSLFS